MLAEAARLAEQQNPRNVHWRQLRAEAPPADPPAVRVATFAQSLHWMDRRDVVARPPATTAVDSLCQVHGLGRDKSQRQVLEDGAGACFRPATGILVRAEAPASRGKHNRERPFAIVQSLRVLRDHWK